jgi:eukaryotic-like serine/threonine-protein kinase
MTPDEARLWREADAALEHLLELPDAERAPFLMTLAAPLRARVERLLAADETGGALDREPAALDEAPAQAGPWRIGEEIGRGGMSVVYRAERNLDGATQVAALKLVTIGALAVQGRERFRREHGLLARLSHPNIVGLLDAGVLDDGTPYIATRLVEGERIDLWCWRRGLDATSVVRLFLQVCEAVAFAHRHLVVHRDLKPANILVDAAGHVHLLDFGIARLLEDADGNAATRTQWRAFTPDYAAPEQFEGRDSGVGVDVFGLGAVLYQVLTGRPPRQGGGSTTSPITLPSRAAAAFAERDPALCGRFRRALRGDLDAVLLQALAARPQDRYADVASLANDLRAWLDLRSVSARRQGLLRRGVMRVRRNPLLSAVSALALLALGAALATALIANRALEQRASELETLVSFQSDMLLAIDPQAVGLVLRGAMESALTEAGDPPAGTWLERPNYTDIALKMLDVALLQRSLDEARARFADQPLVLATLLQSLAYSYRQLGRLEQAVSPQDEAVALRREHLGEGDPLHLMSLREKLKLVRQQHADGGEALHRGVLDLHVRHLGTDHRDTLVARGSLAQWLQQERRHAESELLLRANLQQYERVHGVEYPDTVATRANLARTLSGLGRFDEAEPLYVTVIAQSERVFGPEHEFTQTMRNNLAFTLRSLGRSAEAGELYRAVYEARRQRLGDLHQSTLLSLNNWAAVIRGQGDHAAAEPLIRRAWQGMRAALGERHPNALVAQLNLGNVLFDMGRHAEAEPLLAEAVDAWGQSGYAVHAGLVSAEVRLANIHDARQDNAGAERLLLAAWTHAEALGSADVKARVATELASHFGEDSEAGREWVARAALFAEGDQNPP